MHSKGSIDLDLEQVYQDGLPDHKTVESEFTSPILPVPLARLLPPRVTRGVVRRGVAIRAETPVHGLKHDSLKSVKRSYKAAAAGTVTLVYSGKDAGHVDLKVRVAA